MFIIIPLASGLVVDRHESKPLLISMVGQGLLCFWMKFIIPGKFKKKIILD